MTRIIACLSLFFFLVPVTYVHGPPPPKNDSQVIQLQSISFNAEEPDRLKTGRLEFLAGWKMTSDNDDFGGISAMLALPDDRFLMLSDAGVLIGFTLDQQNDLAKQASIAPLPDGPPVANEFAKQNWDAESLVLDPGTGQYWVGYERYHSVWRYSPSFAHKEAEHKVKAMQQWPLNSGAEAMLRLPGHDGEADHFLVFSESAEFSKGGYQALIFDGDPAEEKNKPKLFGYRPPRGYKITDATLLPDGRALLLHRRFTPLDGVSAILSIGDLSEIAEGKIWSSQRIATLKPPMKVDNMEALAVTLEDGDAIIWMASDDNFNPVQESILMKFRLLPGKFKRKKDKAPANKAPNDKAEASPGFSSIPK
ncbi:esterase-like activity of phytase family protein [Parasphingorhabdus cellanae]|uniref:Esterase-like activity of phytase family protein n=1 Tax=Parasphingorhabdus cellanae TaxID=2806553 RepID=A0ABX7T3V8_9SPHN|nr:esterase-like activity of phytase family protein [Parasphingorhabdus cellanae]QTD54930.1 esterase-like activity of phytase family protein [Parasphingorhabdus cellanae]